MRRSPNRTTQEWQQILCEQRLQKQTDAECAQTHGVSASSLCHWRKKLHNQESQDSGMKIIEVASVMPSTPLCVVLPNGIRLEVTPAWPLENLVQIVGRLRSL